MSHDDWLTDQSELQEVARAANIPILSSPDGKRRKAVSSASKRQQSRSSEPPASQTAAPPPPPPPAAPEGQGSIEQETEARFSALLRDARWVTAESGGKVYFYNSSTRETTWDLKSLVRKEVAADFERSRGGTSDVAAPPPPPPTAEGASPVKQRTPPKQAMHTAHSHSPDQPAPAAKKVPSRGTPGKPAVSSKVSGSSSSTAASRAISAPGQKRTPSKVAPSGSTATTGTTPGRTPSRTAATGANNRTPSKAGGGNTTPSKPRFGVSGGGSSLGMRGAFPEAPPPKMASRRPTSPAVTPTTKKTPARTTSAPAPAERSAAAAAHSHSSPGAAAAGLAEPTAMTSPPAPTTATSSTAPPAASPKHRVPPLKQQQQARTPQQQQYPRGPSAGRNATSPTMSAGTVSPATGTPPPKKSSVNTPKQRGANAAAGPRSYTRSATTPNAGTRGTAAAAASSKNNSSEWRDKIIGLYQQYNPSKVLVVDELLARYKGREEDLWRNLKSKYNSTSVTPVVTPRRRAQQQQQAHQKSVSRDRPSEQPYYQEPVPAEDLTNGAEQQPQQHQDDDEHTPSPRRDSATYSTQEQFSAARGETHGPSYHTPPPEGAGSSPTLRPELAKSASRESKRSSASKPRQRGGVSPPSNSRSPLNVVRSPIVTPLETPSSPAGRKLSSSPPQPEEEIASPTNWSTEPPAQLPEVQTDASPDPAPRNTAPLPSPKKRTPSRFSTGPSGPAPKASPVRTSVGPNAKRATTPRKIDEIPASVAARKGTSPVPTAKKSAPGAKKRTSPVPHPRDVPPPTEMEQPPTMEEESAQPLARMVSPDPDCEELISPQRNRQVEEAKEESPRQTAPQQHGPSTPRNKSAPRAKYSQPRPTPKPKSSRFQQQNTVTNHADPVVPEDPVSNTPPTTSPSPPNTAPHPDAVSSSERLSSARQREDFINAEREAEVQEQRYQEEQKVRGESPNDKIDQQEEEQQEGSDTPINSDDDGEGRFSPRKIAEEKAKAILAGLAPPKPPAEYEAHIAAAVHVPGPGAQSQIKGPKRVNGIVAGRQFKTETRELWQIEVERREYEAQQRREYLAEERNRLRAKKNEELERRAADLKRLRDEEKRRQLQQKIKKMEKELAQERGRNSGDSDGVSSSPKTARAQVKQKSPRSTDYTSRGAIVDRKHHNSSTKAREELTNRKLRENSPEFDTNDHEAHHNVEFDASSPMYSAGWKIARAVDKTDSFGEKYQRKQSSRSAGLLTKDELQKSVSRLQRHYSSPAAKAVAKEKGIVDEE